MKTTSRKKKTWRIVLAVLALFVVIRLALPYVILHYANKTLATMDGYRGHIKDIDLALLRGAYKIDSVYLNKYDSVSQQQTAFFGAKMIDLSVEWKALFKGGIVGELVFDSPTLRFTKDKVEPNQVQKDSSDFRTLLNNFMPLDVNRVEINNGRIAYIDEHSSPKVDIALTNAHLLALNLRNSYDSTSVLPATVTAQADVYEGTLTINARLNPMSPRPTFDVNAEVKNTNLVKLNDFFKAYASVDINRGSFGLYSEAAAKNGRFDGYVKPLITNLKVLGPEDRHDTLLQKIWEGIAGGVAQIFKNQRKDQLATKIPFEGDIKEPETNVWFVIGNILQNAFIRAIQPSLDHEVSLGTVGTRKEEKKTFLEKVFGSKDDKKDKKKKD
ncbi:DUF748 domain-containing protein [Siphonobacter sp. SORGH_AS_1065]|uniref:DUF748 domain-containing protein n=1 Tax=Siphonobacter sp. SORGH_AS_1065 TaxID=3041795 RepID=UPI00277DF135|nr:DUF748 domain-containing protein [Siphonobacter sp. SORGH_AS_1065]MDQ1087609.1 hypothetical protein [Siphonobacter sp. SORGH_AS_1065]